MPDSKQTYEILNLLAKFLLWCWIFGLALLLIWLGVILFAGDFVNRIGGMIGLSNHELDIIHYCGIALLKIQVLVFFFFPWLAIRLMLRGGQA